MQPAPPRLKPRSTFAGRFRITSSLYEGFTGSLYAAETLEGSSARMLRVFLAPRLHDDASARERFAREAAAPTGLEGTHIPSVLAAGVDESTHLAWLSMEPSSGETLAGAVERIGSIQTSDMIEIVDQLREALAPVHTSGRAHGELTPDNLFLALGAKNGAPFTLRLFAFGASQLARDCAGTWREQVPAGASLWMAPEQFEGSSATPRSDVWTLGLLAFYLITGMHYWRAGDLGRKSLESLGIDPRIEPIDPASSRADKCGLGLLLPADFDPWFARCVAREPSTRFSNAGEALGELHELLSTRISLAFRVPRASDRAPTFPWQKRPPPGFEPDAPAENEPQSAKAPEPPPDIRVSQLPALQSDSTIPPQSLSLPATPGARAWTYALVAGLVAGAFVAGVLVGQRFPKNDPRRAANNCPEGLAEPDNAVEAPPLTTQAASFGAPTPDDAGAHGDSSAALTEPAPISTGATLLAETRTLRVDSSRGGAIYDDHITTSSVLVSESCTIDAMNVVVRGRHTYYSDLIVRLRGPNGQSAVLQTHSSRSPFRQYTVARFNGIDARGQWVLSVEDDVGGDSGQLGGFAITFRCR